MVEEEPNPTAGTGQEGIRYHLDLDTGDVWEASDDRVWHNRGTIPGDGAADGLAPSQVTGLTLTPIATYEVDGVTIKTVAIIITWDPVPEADVIGYEIHVDAYDGNFATFTSLWSGGTTTAYDDAIPGHEYFVRVRAYDKDDLYGAWSATESVVTLDDGFAPAIPSDVKVIPGYKLIAVQWTLGNELDLDHYEVQWTDEIYNGTPPVPSGNPDVANAQVITSTSTQVIIAGLGVGLRYYARVRAVDALGWTTTSAADTTPAKAATSPDAGWSAWDDDVTLLVGASDLAVHALAAEFVNTGVLDANRVNTGIMTLGKTTAPGGSPTGIVVYDSLGRFIGWWDQTGMLMVNADSPKEAMWLAAGKLQFTNDFGPYSQTGVLAAEAPPHPPNPAALTATTWTTAITPDGINAEAITFGSSTAGHNLLPNSGFELQPFATVVESTKQWTLAADWAATIGNINMDVSTADLKSTAL